MVTRFAPKPSSQVTIPTAAVFVVWQGLPTRVRATFRRLTTQPRMGVEIDPFRFDVSRSSDLFHSAALLHGKKRM
eukprot:11161067-Lingulodinium_polyedra.AAC.1